MNYLRTAEAIQQALFGQTHEKLTRVIERVLKEEDVIDPETPPNDVFGALLLLDVKRQLWGDRKISLGQFGLDMVAIGEQLMQLGGVEFTDEETKPETASEGVSRPS